MQDSCKRKFSDREETFTDLVSVPSAEQAKESGIVPSIQKLLQDVPSSTSRDFGTMVLQELDDPTNLVV